MQRDAWHILSGGNWLCLPTRIHTHARAHSLQCSHIWYFTSWCGTYRRQYCMGHQWCLCRTCCHLCFKLVPRLRSWHYCHGSIFTEVDSRVYLFRDEVQVRRRFGRVRNGTWTKPEEFVEPIQLVANERLEMCTCTWKEGQVQAPELYEFRPHDKAR